MQLFVEHISNIDCSCLDAEHGLIGASWIVDILLTGQLDEQGMVMDFGDVKKLIKNIIDNNLDHTLIIPTQTNNVTITKKATSCEIKYKFSKGKIEHISPYEAVSLIETDTITLEILEKYLEKIILAALPDNSISVNIKLREEDIKGANYVYSHGLKQHQGNCQRIAHGHRSQIKIIADDKRSNILEEKWASLWHGKYLANQIDIKDTFTENQINYTKFEYQASQGKFQLTIPTACCYLIDNETTIEYISQYICKTLSKETTSKLQIFAYEGINKGAVSYNS